MVCANRFGGPGTILSLKPNLGTIIFVTNKASGLTLGPEDALAINPYTRTPVIKIARVFCWVTSINATMHINSTPVATSLADISFTNSGKEKKNRIFCIS